MPATLSPLRYPGGKSQMYKFVENLVNKNIGEDGTYIEPFAGGAGVAIQLLINQKVNHIVINDLDKSIHSFWYSIINHKDEFIDLIMKTPITIDEWHKQKEIYKSELKNPYSVKGGFATFFLNRTNVSGIIKGGPIGGLKQDGNYKIDCRFNKKKLINKINMISCLNNRITLLNLDAETLINKIPVLYSKEKTFIFFDPPYFSQGKNLYLEFIDANKHRELKESIDKIEDYKWIITYDNNETIYKIYQECGQKYKYQLRYSANNKQKRKAFELLFASPNTKITNCSNIELCKI